MYCTKCGTELSQTAKFCNKCGNSTDLPSEGALPNASQQTPPEQSSATIKCGNCEYMGLGEPARSWLGVILAWLCVIFAPLITIIYFLATSKYRCPKCKSTFVGVKNKEGVFSGRGGNRVLLWVLGIFFGIALLGIMASIVLVSLSSAREKAKEAAFKAQVSSIIPAALLACDERNIIQKDLVGSGEQRYFDVVAVKDSLRQSCGKDGAGTFSFTVNGVDDYKGFSASCSEQGCDFQSGSQEISTPDTTELDTSSDAAIIANVGNLVALPVGETPTLATVSDKSKLANQPFFRQSENGDKVLIYKVAGKAYLYRPSQNRVIDVTTINQ